MSRIIPAGIAALVWLGTFMLHLWFMDVYNDHFDRISRGRQIARYGELPFRDFHDPGYFLTEFSSAAVQWIFGDNLLGETLLTGGFTATGAVIVLLLARRASRSYLLAVAAAALAVLLMPRPYDYDKFFFYPLGVLLCWRYVDRRRAGDLLLLAAGLAGAALFRYDSAAYVAVAAGVALVTLHVREPRVLGRRVLLLAAMTIALALPAVTFVHLNGGLRDALDQVITYGIREARPLQLVVVDAPPPAVDEGASIMARLRTLPVFRMRLPPQLYQSRSGGFVYLFMMVLPFVAGAAVLVRQFRSRSPDPDNAKWWSLIAICVALNLFILRPPIMARIGGMAGPAAVLLAWLAGLVWHSHGAPWAVRRAAVIAAFVALGWTVSLAGNWAERFKSDTPFVERLRNNFAALSESPPDPGKLSMPRLAGLVSYLRECTAPQDAVFATWFVPELYFFSQRPFGGRMAATWQWADARFQRRSGEAFIARPTIVILQTAGYGDFEAMYPILSSYLREEYRAAGESPFGDPAGAGTYRVLAHKDRVPTRTHPTFQVPCFA